MVKSHWKHWQHMQKLYCGQGLSLHVFFTSETDIWVQIGPDGEAVRWAVP